MTQSFGAYVAALQLDRGWSKTALSGAAAMQQMESAVLGPVLGWFLDRFGPRRVIRAGVVILGVGFMLLSQCDELPAFYAAFLVWETSSHKNYQEMTHEDLVRLVSFSPDGDYVASGGTDLSVWKADTETWHIPQVGLLNELAFSPDGQYLLGAIGDGTARIWDTATGKEVARKSYSLYVTSAAFCPDGKLVVSGSGNGTVDVWETATGRGISQFIHSDQVYAVSFSPNGKYVASASLDKTIRIWDAATGRQVSSLQDDSIRYDNITNSIVFSPDGKYILWGSDRSIHLGSVSTGREIREIVIADHVNTYSFRPDGKYLVSGDAGGSGL